MTAKLKAKSQLTHQMTEEDRQRNDEEMENWAVLVKWVEIGFTTLWVSELLGFLFNYLKYFFTLFCHPKSFPSKLFNVL